MADFRGQSRALAGRTTRSGAISWSRVRCDESGNALVMAIAAVLLTGLLMGIVFSSVMFSVGHTTATRAQAASRAAAEGGAQQVARYLLQNSVAASTACPASWDSLDPANWTEYGVDEVAFQVVDGGAWTNCTPTVGVPKLAHAVRIKTTGHSKAVGQVGNSRGNAATVEMIFVRPKSTIFDKAVFGDSTVISNTDFTLKKDPVHPSRPSTTLSPDIVTNGRWSCPAAGSLEGSVIALGGASVMTSCTIKGDFFVKGQLDIGNRLTVLGNLYVNGDLKGSSVHVGGSTLVNGNLELSSDNHKFTGPVRAKGKFSSTNDTAAAFVSTVHIGGVAGTEWGSQQTMNALALAGRFQQNHPMSGPDWVMPTILGAMTPEEVQSTTFPMLRINDPLWDTFVQGDWTTMTAGSRTGANMCNADEYTQPIKITTATKVDLRSCGTFVVKNLVLELSADLVIFTKNFEKNGAMTVRTVNAVGDETRHSLYIVALPTDTQTTCAASGGGDIEFPTNTWNQQDVRDGQIRTKVMLYSAGTMSLKLHPTMSGMFNGQLYGCKIDVPPGITMTFTQAGKDFTDTLWDLSLGSVRDITD